MIYAVRRIIAQIYTYYQLSPGEAFVAVFMSAFLVCVIAVTIYIFLYRQ